MSSTNRGAVRQPDDLYVTEDWAVKAILPHLGAPISVLDPACGTGSLLNAARDFWRGKVELYGYDIVDRGWSLTDIRDALSNTLWRPVDLILANPPYSLAAEMLDRALSERQPHAQVAFLLRLSWLAGLERSSFHRTHPSDVYVLPRRPSFTEWLRWTRLRCPKPVPSKHPQDKWKRCDLEEGHTHACMTIGRDSCEYAWFVWGTIGGTKRGNRWFMLDC